MMVQSGLLVPVNPASEFGIFKQLMIHIGDTQSLEFELSTYSSHLLHMKHLSKMRMGGHCSSSMNSEVAVIPTWAEPLQK